jgi:superfamily I DNA/RNA helicase
MSASVVAAGQVAELSDAQAAVLADWSSATLLLGGPGTGKTTVLTHAMLGRLRADAPPPLLLANSRLEASRLRNLLVSELGEGTWQPRVGTVHALARSLWQRFSGRAEVRLLAAPEQEFRVRELLTGPTSPGWPESLTQAVGTRGFAAQVRAALARARQLGLEPDDLVTFGEAAGRPEWAALGRFFAEYLDVLDAEGVLDYAELVHRVRLLLADPQIQAAVWGETGALLVDDFAELDPAQLALVAAAAGTAPVLAAADPDSVSATFRGADPRAIADFERLLARPGVDVRTVWLEQGHRCGAPITAALSGVRTRLPRPPGSRAPVLVAAREQGEVVVLGCADEAQQARVIAEQLRTARLELGLDYGRMAVLVRSGRRQLDPITRALLAAGVPVEVAGEDIPLAQAPAVRPLLLALEVAAAGEVSPDQAERLLTGPLGGFDAISLRALCRQWWQAGNQSSRYLPVPAQLALLLNDPGWATTAGESAARETRRLAALAGLLGSARRLLDTGKAVDVVAWQLWQGTDWPKKLSAESARGGAPGSRADADLDALCALFETAAEADRRGGPAGVRAFVAELAAQQIPADRQRESGVRRRGVEVLTAHRARGREWDVVVVAGVQEGSWPAGRRLSRLLDASALTADGLGPGTDPRELLAAERRLFHLACSRARRRLVVTATAGTQGEDDTPSRFLAELGVPLVVAAPSRTPVTVIGLVAELRRWSTSATAPDAVREAAALELARLADATDVHGHQLAPSADPRNWWGVRELSSRPEPTPAPIRLSPSQVNSVLTCPRNYFLSRQGGGEGGVAMAATLGSLIHRLVQLAVAEGWGLAEFSAQLDLVWDRLPFEAAWFSASERLEVELALARFLNWRASRGGELVAVEAPFHVELELDGLPIRLGGQVDWLERANGGLLVADFKTSRTQPTVEQVAGMDQLGLYQLAIAAGGFAGTAPELTPVGASAVYLRQAGRPEDTPKEFWQPSLGERPHLSEDPAEAGYETWAHQRLAAAARVVADGRYPATPGPHCVRCPFASSCPADARGRGVVG